MKPSSASTRFTPKLVLSLGCPSGIGPEVAVAAAASVRGARTLLVGDLGAACAAARVRGVELSRVARVTEPAEAFEAPAKNRVFVFEPVERLSAADRRPGRPSRAGGAAQLAWIDAAMNVVSSGIGDALVTAPVSKDAIAHSGAPGARAFRGHTEHLAERLGAREVTMAFWTKALTTSLVTTHLPLREVPSAIDAAGVARAVYFTARFLRDLGETRPLAVASLNPHAGEGGLLGTEEEDVLRPGIERGRARLLREGVPFECRGPIPAESAFRLAASGTYGGVVAMYHDQATIPMKLLGFGDAVNVSLGLPIVRTSVDHGTAYDRAGKGTADARGMQAAMELAITLATRKK
jgi:4-hydroxythreonine-4-phosphate dehydrogenase